MQQQLLPTGRVSYFPMCEYQGEQRFRSFSGDNHDMQVRFAPEFASILGCPIGFRPDGPRTDVAIKAGRHGSTECETGGFVAAFGRGCVALVDDGGSRGDHRASTFIRKGRCVNSAARADTDRLQACRRSGADWPHMAFPVA